MTIKTATIRGVATLEIARPDKKNALTTAMYAQLADALDAASADPAVRAVLITGQPGIFCSGNDLEDFLAQPTLDETSPVARFMNVLSSFDKPVVAAVTGAAIGIGTTMLLHCDFVYVADDARFSMPFVSLGVVPEFGSSWILPQRVGHAKASEWLLLGDPFGAEDAVELGLANGVIAGPEVVGHARRVAERFTQLPAQAVREAKRLMRASGYGSLREHMKTEREVFARMLRSPDAREALQAFFEKRRPDFNRHP